MHYPASSESLRLAAKGNELKDEERSFLFYIQRMCDYQLGRLTLNDYVASMLAWELEGEQRGDSFVISYKLTKFRDGYLGEHDPQEKAEQLQHLRDLVAQVYSLPHAPQAFKLDARLALLYAEGAEIASEFFMVAASVELAHQMGRPANAKQGLLLAARLLAWEQQAEEISQEARTLVHPLLYADTLTIRLTVRISQLTTLTFGVSGEKNRPPLDVLHPLMEQAQEAISIFKRVGNLEGELHAKLRLADLFELGDQVEVATEIARGILPIAQAMGYRDVEDRATEHIHGKTIIALRAKDREELENADRDVTWATITDDSMHSMVSLWMQTCNIPNERFEFVERDYRSIRQIARERLGWCRHLEIQQDKTHAKHAETHYIADPNRKCHCAYHNYWSETESSEWEIVLASFKNTYCMSCRERSPKQG